MDGKKTLHHLLFDLREELHKVRKDWSLTQRLLALLQRKMKGQTRGRDRVGEHDPELGRADGITEHGAEDGDQLRRM